MSKEKEQPKNRFRAEADDGTFYAPAEPLTDEERAEARIVWAKITGQK